MGAGTVGLLTAAVARQAGCAAVTICDVDQGRVDYALDNGFATHGYVVPRPLHASSSCSSMSGSSSSFAPGDATPASSIFSALDGRLAGARATAQDILAASKTTTTTTTTSSTLEMQDEDDDDDDDDDDEDDGVDLTFECTGKEVCMHTSLYATRPGGKVIMVGMGTPIQTLPMSVAHLREVDILGIFRYANTYATGIRMLCASKQGGGAGKGARGAQGLPSLDNMVTHRFKGLHNARDAFDLAGRTVDDEGRLVLKVVIEA